MTRWMWFAGGFLTFVAVHQVEVLEWSAWFGGAHTPWFLNSGRALALALGCLGASSGTLALLDASSRRVRGVTFAAGAFVAMTLVLFSKQGGAGTIFPIVMVVGGALILASCAFGAFVGAEIRRTLRRRH
jgi:hypothetical protein